jgi:enolase
LGNVISGGQHASGESPDIQEFLALPYGAETFKEAALANALIHKRTGEMLRKKDKLFGGGRSDEGAWIASVTNLEALEILTKACEETSDAVGFECGIGLDIAASSLWNSKKKTYEYPREKKNRDTGAQLDFVMDLIKKYHLVYVEDPFHEEDFESFAKLPGKVKNCLICGDDLFTTNVERLGRGVKMHAADAIIIKVNQVGTLTDAWETIEMAKNNKCTPVMSHRSGDTSDWHIAHLAVAFKCPIAKIGVVEGARIVKINELIRIEEFLGDRATMAELKVH